MQISLLPKQKMMTTLFIVALLSLACSLLSIIFLRELLLPAAAASLAALFVLENGRRRIFSVAVSLLIVATDVLLCGFSAYISAEILAISLIIAIFFIRGTKAECSFWITLTFTLFTVLTMVLAAYVATKTLTLDSFLDYYIGMFKEVEKQFVESFSEYSAAFGIPADKATPAIASKLISSMASIIPSLVILAGFAVSGVALKLFTGILRLMCVEESAKEVASWRFSLPKAFYVSFWIVLACNFIVTLISSSGTFAIVVNNVYNVLLFVFAYLGLGVVVSFLTTLFKRRTPAIVVTAGSLLLFGMLAIELISYFGASFVFFGERDAENK